MLAGVTSRPQQPRSPAAANITDVARAAGVSSATVSRVLNGSGTVSPERAARVRQVAQELRYHPSGPARALRTRVADVWTVIVADIENPFFTSVVRGIEDAAREHGCRVVLCNSDEDQDREAEYIEVALAENVSGVVIAAASERTSLTALISRGVPVVAIDRRVANQQVSCVLVDNRASAGQATAHLLETGRQRVGCITGPPQLTTANERLDGYLGALAAAGIPADPALVRRADFRPGGGYAAVRDLFGAGAAPDALFVANNQMTAGALSALRDLRIDVPAQVGVVGFDDAPWATLTRPQVSVVAQPTRELGRRAAILLAEARRDPAAPRQEVILRGQLIIRESSAPRGAGTSLAS
jgi:LacI family transcriptional regulator